MIALISGRLREHEGDTVLIETNGGVGYSITVPLGVLERLPATGSACTLYTELVIREDHWALYGFDRAPERAVFQRLLTASGFGPKLALALLSTLGPERTVRSIQQRDIAALSSVSGIGRKKAEKLVVELGDRFKEVQVDTSQLPSRPGEEAIKALVNLGYPPQNAEAAVREIIATGIEDTARIIRQALQRLAARRD